MANCCGGDCDLDVQKSNQATSLKWVFAINGIMFFILVSAAIYANTSALLADSLDNFGDAATYALSLYALSQGAYFKAKVAYFKGVFIFITALIIFGQLVYKFFVPSMPIFEIMGMFSIVALIANVACLLILYRHRNEDVNMTSVWECSKNDIMVNLSVILAAGGVYLTSSSWPDSAIALILVVLLVKSSLYIISISKVELAKHNTNDYLDIDSDK